MSSVLVQGAGARGQEPGVGGQGSVPTTEDLVAELLRSRAEVASLKHALGIEPTRVITVRLPRSLHEQLKSDAHALKMSMNQLCIARLEMIVGPGIVTPAAVAGEAVGSNEQ